MSYPEPVRQRYHLYSDGSYSRVSGCGGWGAIVLFNGKESELFGGEKDTTNNRMELIAAIEALKDTPRGAEVLLHTDSQYVINGITKWMDGWIMRGWVNREGKPVKNKDLFQELYTIVRNRDVEFKWVRGHNGNVGNEKADNLALEGRLWAERGFK